MWSRLNRIGAVIYNGSTPPALQRQVAFGFVGAYHFERQMGAQL